MVMSGHYGLCLCWPAYCRCWPAPLMYRVEDLAHVQVEKVLSRGGFGVVFTGQFRGLDVAIKVCGSDYYLVHTWYHFMGMAVRSSKTTAAGHRCKHIAQCNPWGGCSAYAWLGIMVSQSQQ